MSPTIFYEKGYRFHFFSREETRMHVHVICDRGEAKFWLEPTVELACSQGIPQTNLSEIRSIVLERLDEIRTSWKQHFNC